VDDASSTFGNIVNNCFVLYIASSAYKFKHISHYLAHPPVLIYEVNERSKEMKMIGNCRQYNIGHCPFSRNPAFRSGFTGKSGPETWFWCSFHNKAIRNVKKCEFAGDYDKQKEAFQSERSEQ